MGCPDCSRAIRSRVADRGADGRGLSRLAARQPKLRVAACPTCSQSAKSYAADGSLSDNTGIGPGSLSNPAANLNDPSTAALLQNLATNPALLNAIVTVGSGGKLSLTQPQLGSSLPTSMGGSGDANSIPVNPSAPLPSDAANALKKKRRLEILVLVGIGLLAVLGVVAYKRSQAPASALA